MTDGNVGPTAEQEEAAFRAGIREFAAEHFFFSFGASGFLRIAFGNAGLPREGGKRPVFHHAVTIPNDYAVDLARQILAKMATPEQAAGNPPAHP